MWQFLSGVQEIVLDALLVLKSRLVIFACFKRLAFVSGKLRKCGIDWFSV